MTSQNISLTLAYLRKLPASAAKILEQHDAQYVSVFLGEVPTPIAASVISNMQPYFVARICCIEKLDAIAGILSNVEVGKIASVLRHLDPENRQRILDALPTKIGLQCKLSLNYAEDAVGAWMTSRALIVSHDCSVAEAIQAIRNAEDLEPMNYVYLLDREQHIKGRIHYIDLFQANPELPIAAIAKDNHSTLRGNTKLRLAAKREDWNQHDALPVENRRHQFIGVLLHSRLREGIGALADRKDPSPKTSLLASFIDDYANGFLAAAGALSNIAGLDPQK